MAVTWEPRVAAVVGLDLVHRLVVMASNVGRAPAAVALGATSRHRPPAGLSHDHAIQLGCDHGDLHVRPGSRVSRELWWMTSARSPGSAMLHSRMAARQRSRSNWGCSWTTAEGALRSWLRSGGPTWMRLACAGRPLVARPGVTPHQFRMIREGPSRRSCSIEVTPSNCIVRRSWSVRTCRRRLTPCCPPAARAHR